MNGELDNGNDNNFLLIVLIKNKPCVLLNNIVYYTQEDLVHIY